MPSSIRIVLTSLACLLLNLAVCSACGARRAGSGPGLSPVEPTVPTLPSGLALPFPEDRLASAGGHVLNGNSTAARSSGATDQGSALRLVADASGVQYGVYAFTTQAPVQQVEVTLDSSMTSAAWIGLADYQAGHWQFSGPYTSTQLLSLSANNVSPQQHVFVAVVAAPIATAKVDKLELFEANLPPVAVIRTSPHAPGLPVTVQFSGADSSDPDGTIAKYEWDMDDDGVYELDSGSTATAQNIFLAYATYRIALRVTDNSGATGATSFLLGIWQTTQVDHGADLFGGVPTMALIGGKPALGYVESTTPHALAYFCAGDEAGSTWGAPVEVVQNCSGWASLREAGGRPAVAFSQFGAGFDDPDVAVYSYAKDAAGSQWFAPTVLDSTHGCRTLWMDIIDGKPAVGYMGTAAWNDQTMCYCAAADATGSSWASPFEVEHFDGGFAGCFFMAASGRPAFAAIEGGNYFYQRAADAGGTTWPAGTDTGHQYGWFHVVDGIPAIAFPEPDHTLNYCRAADADGTSWSGAELAASGWNADIAAPLVLMEREGKPAVVYGNFDSDFGQLRFMFVSSSAAAGGTWSEPIEFAEPDSNTLSIATVELADHHAGIAFIEAASHHIQFVREP